MFNKHLTWYKDDSIEILQRPLKEYFNDPELLFSTDRIRGILKLVVLFFYQLSKNDINI